MVKRSSSVTPVSALLEDWADDEIKMIRETVAQQATEDELKLFLYTAKARGLNPLLKQIYFIKRKQKRGERWMEVGTIQTGIDGFRLIANRTGKLRGIERGTRRDENGKLLAWARIWRKDWEYPAYEEVAFDEYKGETALWHRMPEQMLKKCAEAAALRMAFPEDLSGLYSHEEMDQADHTTDLPEKLTIPQAVEAESKKWKSTQKSMKECLQAITHLQEEHGLTKEELQWITGLETFKGVDLETLEKAHQAVMSHCRQEEQLIKDAEKELQEANAG